MRTFFSTKVHISPEVLSQEVAGETVLLDLQGENYFGLNELGTRVWQLLHDHDDLQEVYQIILSEYDVEPDQLRSDLLNLLNNLSDEALITLDNESTL